MSAMDREALLEKTKKELRSVLISAPRGVPERLLLSDFRKVLGKELPYRELGFRNLGEFVYAASDVIRLGQGPTGEPTFFGVANTETAQIARFVATQKKTKLKKSMVPPPTSSKVPVRAAFTKKSPHYGPRYNNYCKPNFGFGKTGTCVVDLIREIHTLPQLQVFCAVLLVQGGGASSVWGPKSLA